MNTERVDLLLEYALAVAGQEDVGRRELGAIHLLKYVYLADLAYAERHAGTTYTGAAWRFYHYGPWSPEVHDRIAPAARHLCASERRYASPKYEGEAVRWVVEDDEELARTLESRLDTWVARAIRRGVHEYGADTTGLLHFVYATRPMLRASPGEPLNFAPPGTEVSPAGAQPASSSPPLSTKARKRRQAALDELRARVRQRLEVKNASRVPASPAPRYDDTFVEGTRWLDDAATADAWAREGELIFADDIWKSRGRGDPG